MKTHKLSSWRHHFIRMVKGMSSARRQVAVSGVRRRSRYHPVLEEFEDRILPAQDHFAVIAPGLVTAGTAFSVSVTALNASNATDTTYAGTVVFSSTDPAGGLPASSTLQGGTGTFSVILKTAASQTVTATDSANSRVRGISNVITVNPSSAATFAISTINANTNIAGVGVAFSFSVMVLDQFGNLVPGYTGSVHFTSTDSAATLPANRTLTNGVGTISVTFGTIGTQTVIATDALTSSITGTSSPIPVSIVPTLTVVTAPPNAVAGVAFTVSVTALASNTNPPLGFNGPCPITTGDNQAVLPPNVTLSNGIGTFTAILNTAGSQNIQVFIPISGASGAISVITVSAAAATHFGFTGPTFATSGVPFSLTVKALDPYGNTAVSYNGTVKFSSSDAAAVLPAAGTLTNGAGTFSVTLSTEGNQTLIAADTLTSSFTTTSTPITVSGAATHFAVSVPNAVTAGTPFSSTIIALDASNNTATGYNGDVKITSGDPLVLPATAPLTNGVNIYPIATLETVGSQTLTVQDTTTSSLFGVSAPILVSPALATAFVLSGVPSNFTAGVPFLVTVTARDRFNNIATGYASPINFASSDPQASLPTGGTLTSGVGTFALTLGTVGSQSIVATGVGQTLMFSSRVVFTVYPQAITAGDFNNDGKTDIAGGSSSTGAVSVVLGNGNGTFSSLVNSGGGVRANGVATADFNGDGNLDLAETSADNPTVTVLLGNGNGTFKAKSNSIGSGNIGSLAVATGDFNGDGVPDLAVACGERTDPSTAYVAILLGIGDGTFQPAKFYAVASNATTPGYPQSIAVGDLNHDGKLDLAVTNNGAVSVLLGNGDGSFNFADSYPIGMGSTPISSGLLALADLNGDGNVDIAAANYISSTVSVLLNNGNGTFKPATNYLTNGISSLAVADFNGDGIPDLAIDDGSFGQVEVELGKGDGSFANPQTFAMNAGGQSGLAVADLNGDGRPDIVVARNNFTVFLNQPVTISNSSTLSVNSAVVNHFAVTGIPPGVIAGTPFNLTITAQDQFYNTATGYSGTVHFVSSDKNAMLPVDATLTNGVATFSATFTTVGPQTITAYDAANNANNGRSALITVSAGASHFLLGAPASIAAGSVFVFSVSALDQFNNIVAGYGGTVRLTTSDGQATLQATAVLSNGVGFFAAVLRTAGNQTITATAATTSITGTSAVISVAALAAHQFAVTAPNNAITGTAFSLTVTAEDPFGNTAANYTGTVQFAGSDTSAVLPPNTTLTGGSGVFSATLKTPGSQTLTAADIAVPNIAGTSNNIATLGLVVTSLTPTPSGFIATFNKPFDPTAINLYDSIGTLGPDDVLLTGPGAPQTSFHGSLIIDPTDTTITFVKTSTFTSAINSFNPSTGVLAAGTYTVTFRSAANGFKDLLGIPLDGTASGNAAGSNFTTTFVVSSTPAEVVGIPGFARGPSNAVNLPNNLGLGIPINLSDGTNVISGNFTLQYNSALLNITGTAVNSALAGATLTLDGTSTPGNAVIDFTSSAPLPAGVIRLGGIVATVPNSAAPLYKSKTLLHFSSVQLNGGAIAVTADDAVEVDAYLGAATGDGTLSGGDSAAISRVATGLDDNPATGTIGGFTAYQLADPVLIGDLTGSGSVNAAGVTLINSYLTGTARTQLPAIPTNLTIPATGPDPALSLPSDLQLTVGGTVVVPVDIDTARPAGSTGMTEAILALKFDPTVFTVSAADVQLGSLPNSGSGWQLEAAVNSQTGAIGIDLFSSSPIQTTAAGSLVTITLHAQETAPAGATLLRLLSQGNPTGQRVYETLVSDAQGALVLHTLMSTLGAELSEPCQISLTRPAFGSQFADLPPATAIPTAVSVSTATSEAALLPIHVMTDQVNPVEIDAVMVEQTSADPENEVPLSQTADGSKARLFSPSAIGYPQSAIALGIPSAIGNRQSAVPNDSAFEQLFGDEAPDWLVPDAFKELMQ